ncbi:MAG: hypothetical protein RLZZ435_2341 [Cyanobacteriota bacterium]|jgi:uncharacterized protein (DUF433 family)
MLTEAEAMNLNDYFHILAPDDIRIQGTRIGIETVLYEYLYRAKTPEEIHQSLDSLSLEQVYATILYYLHNRESINTYLADWLHNYYQAKKQQQENPSPARIRIRQLTSEQRKQLLAQLAPANVQESLYASVPS